MTILHYRYISQGSRETSLYVLDCLFSVLIVGTLVVFVWRGAWTILDLYLYPDSHCLSAWSSLVSTVALALSSRALQSLRRRATV